MTIYSTSGLMAMVGEGWRPPDTFEEFRIVRSLGEGSMGQVYLAHDTLLDRPVAIKFVHAAPDPAARARVLDEARAIARLSHPNVVAIYRVAELSGRPYLVSEYVQGHALHQLDRPMPWRQVLDIARDLARGLAAAHRRGVLHRDVKPANAVLADDGCAKLLDFGLATRVDAAPSEPVALSVTATSDSAAGSVSSSETEWVGTPRYMAPELWRAEPATPRSDLYSLGLVLYELMAGTLPNRDTALTELAAAAQRDLPPLADVAIGVEPSLARVVDRLVLSDPAARFASADALLVALEACTAPSDGVDLDGNPYRGLAAFEPAHAALFFGRRIEIRELVDRVRVDALVVVGGDSGTGKSSLCRAGVLPWLVEHDGWSCAEVIPGRHPVRSLAAALAPWAGGDEATIAARLRDDPDAVARAIRQRLAAAAPRPGGGTAPARLVVFFDQLEELLTLAPQDEARVAAAAIAALCVRSPWLRLLATARADFLSRLAMLPDLGDEITRRLYFLRPLTGEHIREVVVRPAAVKGVVYESEALIDALIAATQHAPGGLPLLQFTLTELWEARDTEARTIRATALTALGGVAGALTRHADRLLAGLGDSERVAARRILLRLVTSERTRARRTESELVATGTAGDAERAALEALVRGRVVVANRAQNGAYEIAHEALLTSWSTLQRWLAQDAASHAVRERVEQAAGQWERSGRPNDLLWGRRRLADARALDRTQLAPRDAAFLAAGAAALRRRWLIGTAATAALVLGAITAGLAIRTRARRELAVAIADQVSAATVAQTSARALAAQRDVAQRRALGQFDARQWHAGEAVWSDVEDLAAREDHAYRAAAAHLESVLQIDPGQTALYDWLADLTLERLVRAERDRRHELADELASRLGSYDDGRRRAALAAPARVELTIEPPGTKIWSERAASPRQLVGTAPLPAITLPAGSLVLVLEAPGRVPVRVPLLLSRGETLPLTIRLPDAATAPRGMIYVPAGRFLFGSADNTELRQQFFKTVPLHEVSTAAYYIARHEVTLAEWIAYLDALPPAERRMRTPHTNSSESSIALVELAPQRWQLRLAPSIRVYTAEAGQRLHYEARDRRADQDWLRFPVAGVSYDDAMAYVSWLDRTRRLPGARLCDEYEWERAARGADGRAFPGGDTLGPDDANIEITYGRQPLAFGPDEVGSHPSSRSPFGADDMAGNVWEWTRSVESAGTPVVRGGAWYFSVLSARTANREPNEPTQRMSMLGLRVCATPQ